MNKNSNTHTFGDLNKKQRHKAFLMYDFIRQFLKKELKNRPVESLTIFFVTLFATLIFLGILISLTTDRFNIKFTAPSISLPSFSLPNILGAQITTGGNSSEYMDPILLLEKIRSGADDYLLIDIRSLEEYELGHIKTAISMPVYGADLVDEKGNVSKGRIKEGGREIFKDHSLIVIYGHSSHSVLPQEVADAIGDKAKVLSVGWNEWAHFKSLWVPEEKWNDIDISNYVQVKEE